MQRRGDSPAAAAVLKPSWRSIQTEDIMMAATGRRPRGGPRRWRLLTPTVLWSVVILAMAPSFYGFTGGRGGFPTGRWAGRSGAGGVAAADLASATAAAAGGTKGRRGGSSTAESTGSAKGSPFAAASWLKERVRDGKRRVHMQMMSMVSDASVDTMRFEDAPVPVEERGFHINGWRWHSRAVLRDVGRPRSACGPVGAVFGVPAGGTEVLPSLVDETARVGAEQRLGFTKLHNTETSLFFPWLRDLVPREDLPPLSEFDREREGVVRIGKKIGQFVAEAERASKAKTSPRAALLRCADLAEELEAKAARLARAQEAAIMPATAAYVTSKQQWKFNDKVIFSLGLVDAQVFLVSMHDAIKPDREEFNKFRKNVPKFARALIPTWRRVLYLPRAGCLEETADVAAVAP
ncbi:unnamed protein product [Scytosiphon promiscuus]